MLRILGLCFGALLCCSVSCMFTEPGELANHGDGPIPGIAVGEDGPAQVVKVLGKPSATASGWWRDVHHFDIEFKVWYYKGVGRVVFYPEMDRVYTTEADKHQTGSVN